VNFDHKITSDTIMLRKIRAAHAGYRTGRSKRIHTFLTKDIYPVKAYRWLRMREREFHMYHKCYSC